MIRLLVGAVLALTAVNVIAGNMYIYKDKGGQVLLTNVNPSSNFDKFTKKVKVTYYVDKNNEANKSDKKQIVSEKEYVSFGTNSDTASYSNSAYDALR